MSQPGPYDPNQPPPQQPYPTGFHPQQPPTGPHPAYGQQPIAYGQPTAAPYPPAPPGQPYPPQAYPQPVYVQPVYIQQPPPQYAPQVVVQGYPRKSVTAPRWSFGEILVVFFTCGLAWPFIYLSHRGRKSVTRHY
ncbi:hypothetical protein [Herbidospora cretacea]|uniref:hypothetical protein n=1 Tax=Herbidospora cretacea TaxID=28444 RepID=UPI0004C3921E|nr:hypothetical protein [Herbidospora cretacea]